MGPILVYGLLFLPPLAARQLATGLASFLRLVVVAGLVAVIAAWPISLAWDWPYGPSAVCVAGVEVILATLAARLLGGR